jgi:hypothetical protein
LEWSAFSASFATPSFTNQISLDWLWAQENPQFQIEVGLANLSMGGAALAAALLGWGSWACGITLLIYGLYISCTSLLHIREALHPTEKKEHSLARIAISAVFALALLGFAVIAFHGA